MRAILISFSGLALILGAAGCGGNNNADDQPPAECSDGQDNDGDGQVDFPDDLGCVSAEDTSENSPTSAKCQDGRDNDGDGRTDYPSDPGCFAPQADDETDDCPSGPNCAQCSDGQDNDGNGVMDYPNDPGCEAAADDEEFPINPVACGAGLVIQTLPVTGIVEGSLDASSTSTLISPCGGGGGAPARAYVLHLDAPKVVELSTDDIGTTADTIIDLRAMNCSDASAEISCNDDIDDDNTSSSVTASLDAGSYYIIVSGIDSATSGSFRLQVKLSNGEGTACVDAGDCGPGLVCRVPADGSTMVCSRSVCDDGLDDDADGKIDYPADPGCATPDDTDEADDCPSGPNCPECADGDDNDGDGQTDYPNDSTCQAAGDASESCTTTDGVTQITTAVTMGDTSTANNDVRPSCASSTSHTAKDRTYRIDVPALSSLTISADPNFDAVMALYNESCTGADLDCDDFNNELTFTDVMAGTYFLVIDGWGSGSGTFELTITGKIENGASCESPLVTAGALSCGPGHACKGATNAKTCLPALCGDGVDNDGDGDIDYPFDPGCSSIADDTEDDPTPLPACADGIDNDSPLDGLIDFPADYGCSAASGTSEAFCAVETDPTTLISMPVTTGTTIGKTHNQAGTCAGSTATAPDVTYALSLPVPVDTLLLDTIGTDSGFDSVLYVKDPTCAMQLACNDDGGGNLASKITMTSVAPGNYAVVVDHYSNTKPPGPFTLNIKGTVAPQTVCTDPLFTAGVLACPTGTTCKNAASTKRCQP